MNPPALDAAPDVRAGDSKPPQASSDTSGRFPLKATIALALWVLWLILMMILSWNLMTQPRLPH